MERPGFRVRSSYPVGIRKNCILLCGVFLIVGARMNTLTKKLGLAVLVGLVIVALTWGLAPAEQRPHLLLDALKHLGVIVIGIAAVEVVWAWAGGSPTSST